MNNTEEVAAQAIRDEIERQLPDLKLTSMSINCTLVAQVAIKALGLTQESYTAEAFETKAVMGGEGNMRYGGQTIRSLGYKTRKRLIGPWVEQVNQ